VKKRLVANNEHAILPILYFILIGIASGVVKGILPSFLSLEPRTSKKVPGIKKIPVPERRNQDW